MENQNLIHPYGGFPICASKMGEIGKCVSIIWISYLTEEQSGKNIKTLLL